jgi:hypothetical protein
MVQESDEMVEKTAVLHVSTFFPFRTGSIVESDHAPNNGISNIGSLFIQNLYFRMRQPNCCCGI